MRCILWLQYKVNQANLAFSILLSLIFLNDLFNFSASVRMPISQHAFSVETIGKALFNHISLMANTGLGH